MHEVQDLKLPDSTDLLESLPLDGQPKAAKEYTYLDENASH